MAMEPVGQHHDLRRLIDQTYLLEDQIRSLEAVIAELREQFERALATDPAAVVRPARHGARRAPQTN